VLCSPLKKNTKKKQKPKKRRLRRDERNIVVNKRVSENENFTHTLFPLMANKKKTNKRDFVKWLE